MTDEWPHHWTIAPNLAYIKIHGRENWLKAQREEWACNSCAGEIMWYQKSCSCGKQLSTWDPPPSFSP
jgi:hypothetical protein